jgi:hypothetical protein
MRFKGKTIENQPCSKWPEIHRECAKYERFVVEVTELDSDKDISNQQMRYLHAAVFPLIAKETHCSLWQAEFDCKRWAGNQWFMKKIGDQHFVLSKTSLTIKQTNEWIKNIIDWAATGNIHVPEPDRDWRRNKKA